MGYQTVRGGSFLGIPPPTRQRGPSRSQVPEVLGDGPLTDTEHRTDSAVAQAQLEGESLNGLLARRQRQGHGSGSSGSWWLAVASA